MIIMPQEAHPRGPVAAILKRLTRCKRIPGGYLASCPVPSHGKGHGDRHPSLSVTEGDDGRALLTCHAGCSTDDVLSAIDLSQRDLFEDTRPQSGRRARLTQNGLPAPSSADASVRDDGGGITPNSTATRQHAGLTIENYAEAKGFRVDVLRCNGITTLQHPTHGTCVRLPYLDENGAELTTRYRLSMTGDKFRWKAGTNAKGLLYGAQHLPRFRNAGASYVAVVEGESDCHAAWHHDVPAIGIPGAAMWDEANAARLAGFEKVYIVIEPDRGGDAVKAWLAGSAIRDRAHLVRLAPFKDLSELHASGADLDAAWKDALARAVPWNDAAQEATSSASRSAPPWPAGVLPPPVDAYVTAQARAIGVPVDMVAVPLLVFAAGTIGNAMELQVKRLWTVLPALWAGVVAPPGKKKSPALIAGQWPVNALQKRIYDEWKADLSQWEADQQAWTDTPKEKRGEKPQPPQMDHLYTTDATLEALVDMLNQCCGVSIIRDELAGFIGAMDKYRGGKGDDRQQYLSLWAGAPVKVDRKTGGTAYTTHPAASVFGGIQPDYARELHSASGKRDGMVERFLLWWPDVPRSGWTDDDVDPTLLDPVVDTFAALRSIRTRLALSTTNRDAERYTIEMHSTAKHAFIEWFNANDAATEQASGLRQGFYSKLDSQLARIALVLHCLHNPDDPRALLSEATMRAAIDVVEFFRAHLDRVLPLIGDHSTGEPVGLPARILRYLRTPELQDGDGWVRRGRLLHKLSNVAADDLTRELNSLQDRGTVESRTVDSATKPSEQWRICSTDRAKNQNNQSYSAEGDSVRCDSSDSSNSSDRLHSENGHHPGADDLDGFMPTQGTI